MGSTQTKEEREGKVNWRQTRFHYYTCAIQEEREHRDASNDMTKAWFQPSLIVARAARKWQNGWCVSGTCQQPFFMCTKLKMPPWLKNNSKKESYEITTKPLKSRLNFLNGKCNEVNKKIKVPLELNNNNKKILKK